MLQLILFYVFLIIIIKKGGEGGKKGGEGREEGGEEERGEKGREEREEKERLRNEQIMVRFSSKQMESIGFHIKIFGKAIKAGVMTKGEALDEFRELEDMRKENINFINCPNGFSSKKVFIFSQFLTNIIPRVINATIATPTNSTVPMKGNSAIS
ncbi:MAG: hypothetical protein IIC21_06040, partial [Chloroflexi bacterium]|nr:hypothetical protein [Chloroflexota bacterium]